MKKCSSRSVLHKLKQDSLPINRWRQGNGRQAVNVRRYGQKETQTMSGR